MVSTAFVFPGQGSQYAGMGRRLMHLPAVAATLEECAVATALPTADYVLDTPDAALCETECAQPAIFALSVGLARTLLDEGVRPTRFAGHSVGHFAALAASGALGLGDAARLVARRGQLMAAAGRRRPGGMGIVHGLDAWTVAEVLRQCNLPLWPANLNLPRQTAVSGEQSALDEARIVFTDLGGRWRRLNVSGAFHSPLLDEEAAQFAALVDALDIAEPRAPVLRNRDGVPLTRPECIREDLKGHMTGPVRWVAVMDALRAAGTRLALEAGPGAVLTRLMQRYARDLPVMSTDSTRSLQRAVRAANREPQERRR